MAGVSDKIGKGISPQAFIEGMTQNKEKFMDWYGRFEWPNDADKEYFESLNNRDDIRCLILAADWCGDVVRNVPVVFQALAVSGIPTDVFIQEQHMDLMDQFLTMGGRSIPVVIFADTGGHVLGHWGPRPAHVQAVMEKFKQENPDRSAPDYDVNMKAARSGMMRQYGEDSGYQSVIVKELRRLLETF